MLKYNNRKVTTGYVSLFHTQTLPFLLLTKYMIFPFPTDDTDKHGFIFD